MLDKLKAIGDGEVAVVAQFARRDTEDGHAPDWGDPRPVTLCLQTLIVGRTRRTRKPSLCITVKDFAWAEYSEDDCSEDGREFLCEEYRMRVLSLV